MAGVCTGSGVCDVRSLGKGKNWVTKADPVGGLGPYLRAIANALKRSGHSEQDAIRLAVGVVRRWAEGKGDVSQATRDRAKAALAHWEAIRAKSHDHTKEIGMTVDLAADSMAARMMPDRARLIAVAKKVEKWPEGPRKANMKRVIAARAKQLHVEPDGDNDFDMDVPRKGADLSRADGSPDAAERKAALAKGEALPPLKKGGEPRFPVDTLSLFKRAVHMVQLAKSQDPTVRRFLMAIARKRRWTAAIPATRTTDGTLQADPS